MSSICASRTPRASNSSRVAAMILASRSRRRSAAASRFCRGRERRRPRHGAGIVRSVQLGVALRVATHVAAPVAQARSSGAPSRRCRPRRPACRRGSAAPGRSAAPSRRGSATSAARRRWRPRRPARAGRARRAPSRWVSSARNRSVCQASISSVMPLNVLPSITNPPVRVARRRGGCWTAAPRRRPLPHSTASTTRSRVCRGLTFTQPDPRRPASYGAASDFTTTPSWPSADASRRRTPARRRRTSVTIRGTWSASGSVLGQHGEPLARGLVEQVARRRRAARRRSTTVSGTRVAARRPSVLLPVRDAVSWNGRGRPSARSAITSPSSTSASTVRASTASTTSGSRSVTSSRLRV